MKDVVSRNVLFITGGKNMWIRADLKDKAKINFRKNYWMCVVAALILGLVITISTSSSSGAAGIVSIALLLLGVFVFNVIQVGGCRFFIENAYENPRLNKLLFAFESGNYGNMVLTMFLMQLYTVLWSLLLMIPGIIKTYEYRMIPYLLADCPDMPRKEAFKISKEMMYGNKMAAFILDMSFIGWVLAAAFTCGLVGIFWTAPYQYATNAELFLALKEEYFSNRNIEQVEA